MSFPIASSGFAFHHALQELYDTNNTPNDYHKPTIQKIQDGSRNKIYDYIHLYFDDGSDIGIGNMWEYLLDTTISRGAGRECKLVRVEIAGQGASESFLTSERITKETKDLWREIMRSQNK